MLLLALYPADTLPYNTTQVGVYQVFPLLCWKGNDVRWGCCHIQCGRTLQTHWKLSITDRLQNVTITHSIPMTSRVNVVTHAGSWARLAWQHGCRTPNAATHTWQAGKTTNPAC